MSNYRIGWQETQLKPVLLVRNQPSSTPQKPENIPIFFRHLATVLASLFLLGALGCGGGGNSPSTRGGGGGGNGGSAGGASSPCTQASAPQGGNAPALGVGTQVQNTFFGLHVNSTNSLYPTVPFGAQRLWDAGVGWAIINTSQGVYDWSTMDVWLSDAQQHGVDLLYNLARTPTWASSGPSDTSCAYNSIGGGPGQCHPPTDLNSDGTGADAIWISWVSAVVQHSVASSTGHIKYYEIWNEWNIPLFWVGSIQQLVRMEQDARCVVEGPPAGQQCNPNSSFPSGIALDPNARIVTPSAVGSHSHLDAVSAQMSDYFSTQVNGDSGGDFADAIGFHGYVGTGTSGTCPVPEEVNTVISDLHSTADQFSSFLNGKPLFNTEGGWSKADQEGFLDPQRQTAFLARYLLLQQSAGISRVYWYLWDSPTNGSLYNGATGQVSDAGNAYGVVNHWTVGATVGSACSASGTIWSCAYTRPGGYAALAVWDASQDCTTSNCPTTTFTVPGGVSYTEYRDVQDNVTPLNGASTVPVGAKPILLETGPIV